LALARRLGVGVEMAVFVDSATTGTDSITTLAAELEDMSHLAVRWCVYRAREVYAGAPWPGADRPRLHAIAPGSVCVGTDGDFIFLGRFTGIPPAPADAVCFSINPQVHAFDEHSITETLGVHAQAVATARVIAMGRAVVVSPVTLRPRRNLYTSDGSAPRLDPDPRVKSLWCAGWTLVSLAQLALGGAARVTFHATHGPGGVAGTPTADVLRRALATRPTQLAPSVPQTPSASAARCLSPPPAKPSSSPITPPKASASSSPPETSQIQRKCSTSTDGDVSPQPSPRGAVSSIFRPTPSRP